MLLFSLVAASIQDIWCVYDCSKFIPVKVQDDVLSQELDIAVYPRSVVAQRQLIAPVTEKDIMVLVSPLKSV